MSLKHYIEEAVNTPKEGSYGFVYLTINKVNNRAYVGMCSSKKSNAYIGSGTLLKIAIKKYGKENFSRTILESCATEQELREAEKRWIEKFDAVNSEQFYNLSEGGRGGKTANYRKMSSIVKATWDAMTAEERKARMQKTNSSNKQTSWSICWPKQPNVWKKCGKREKFKMVQ